MKWLLHGEIMDTLSFKFSLNTIKDENFGKVSFFKPEFSFIMHTKKFKHTWCKNGYKSENILPNVFSENIIF